MAELLGNQFNQRCNKFEVNLYVHLPRSYCSTVDSLNAASGRVQKVVPSLQCIGIEVGSRFKNDCVVIPRHGSKCRNQFVKTFLVQVKRHTTS